MQGISSFLFGPHLTFMKTPALASIITSNYISAQNLLLCNFSDEQQMTIFFTPMYKWLVSNSYINYFSVKSTNPFNQMKGL